MTTDRDYESEIEAALRQFAECYTSLNSEGMLALARFVSGMSKRSSGASLYGTLAESERLIQELMPFVWETLTPEQRAEFPSDAAPTEVEDVPLPRDLPDTATVTADEDDVAVSNDEAIVNVLDEDAPPEKATVEHIVVSEQMAARAVPKTRRQPSKMYDFAMLDAARYHRALGRPVGMKDLFDLGYALDVNTKKGSHTAQLNRWKEQQFLYWRESSDISLTQAGEARRNDLLRYVTPAQREQIRDAFQKTLGIMPTF